MGLGGPGFEGRKVPHAEAAANFGKGVRELGSRVWACPFMSLLTPKWIQMAKWPRVLHVQTGNLDQMWSSGKISEQEVPSHGFASPEFNPVSSCRGRAKESGTQKHGGSAGYGFSWRFHTFSKETTSGLKDPDWRCIQDVSLWPPLLNFHTFLLAVGGTEAASFRQPPPGPGWAGSVELGDARCFGLFVLRELDRTCRLDWLVVWHGRTWPSSWCFSAEVGHFTHYDVWSLEDMFDAELRVISGHAAYCDEILHIDICPPVVKHSNGKVPIYI